MESRDLIASLFEGSQVNEEVEAGTRFTIYEEMIESYQYLSSEGFKATLVSLQKAPISA